MEEKESAHDDSSDESAGESSEEGEDSYHSADFDNTDSSDSDDPTLVSAHETGLVNFCRVHTNYCQ